MQQQANFDTHKTYGSCGPHLTPGAFIFPRAHIINVLNGTRDGDAKHASPFSMDILQADDASLLDPESVCEATPFGDRLEDALDVLVELDGLVARLLLLEVQSNYYKSKKIKISYILKRKEYFASNI